MLSQLCALSSAAAKLKMRSISDWDPTEMSARGDVCVGASCAKCRRYTFNKTSGECTSHVGVTQQVCFYFVPFAFMHSNGPATICGRKSVGPQIKIEK